MNSIEKSAEWIAREMARNPCVDLKDGNFRTTICRLSFPNVFARSKPIPPNVEGKYGANLVFPVGADLSVLKSAASETALAEWPKAAEGMKLKTPFKDQGEMLKYEGYEEGGVFITATADQNKPRVFDSRMVPIVDEDRVYPGVWAICVVRPFSYDKGVNRGVSFGLQAVMIVADDKQLGGGGIDPQTAFGGVQIDSEVNPQGMFADPEQAAKKALFG